MMKIDKHFNKDRNLKVGVAWRGRSYPDLFIDSKLITF